MSSKNFPLNRDQMKLFYSSTSPYVRKVLIIAHELGLFSQIELVLQALNPTQTSNLAQVSLENPLAKIPTLHVPGLGALYGSQVIIQYFLSITTAETAAAFVPLGGGERFKMLTRESLADGALDALLLCRFESFLRPQELRWDAWILGQQAKVVRALDELERIHAEDKSWNLGAV
ncbi:hypothetical protein BC830DRAFT_1181499, partial [Chytriomyces sp. MP71]